MSEFSPFNPKPAPPPPPSSPYAPIRPTGPVKPLIKRPWFLIVAASFVVILVIGFSVNQIMRALLHSRPEVVVPQLEGKGILDALAIVSAADLSLQQESVDFDESLPAGTVVRQHPPSGMQVRAGRAIRVVVSKGGQVFFVPAIVGKPLAEAQSVLASDGLQVGAVSEVYSVDHSKGLVVTQSPVSGEVVTRGALVDITVSRGLPPAGMPLLPDFKGQTADQVRTWAQGVGSSVQIREDSNAVGVSGTVIKQAPAPGQPLLEGDKVRITIVPMVASGQSGRLTYQVPSDVDDATVRIMARDNRGESQIYQGRHEAGETVEVPLGVNSTTRVRIYVNDILKDERVIEP